MRKTGEVLYPRGSSAWERASKVLEPEREDMTARIRKAEFLPLVGANPVMGPVGLPLAAGIEAANMVSGGLAAHRMYKAHKAIRDTLPKIDAAKAKVAAIRAKKR